MLADLPEPPLRKLIRLAAGWTLAQVAAELGVPRASVRQWETGTTPRPATAGRYLALLDRLTEEATERCTPGARLYVGELAPARITEDALAGALPYRRRGRSAASPSSVLA